MHVIIPNNGISYHYYIICQFLSVLAARISRIWEREREREREMHTKDRPSWGYGKQWDEEETFRVDCAEEEAWTLGFLLAEPVSVLLH